MNEHRFLTGDAAASSEKVAGVAPGPSTVDEASLAEVYRRRAAFLACPPAEGLAKTNRNKIVLFQLGDETYGLPMSALDRIFSKPICTPVPGVGSRWAGVFPVQGEIIPILDLARVLDLPEGKPDSSKNVLTLHVTGRKLGLLVGTVLEICEWSAESLCPAGNQVRYLKGVGPDNTLILDIDRLTEQEFSQ